MNEPTRYLGRELHLHVTGSVSAALVPWWVHWFRFANPDVIVNVSVTQAALQFTTLKAFEELADGRVWSDAWDYHTLPRDLNEGSSGASECFIIFPATLDCLVRLAQGRANTPALLMLQVTRLPIIIADSVAGSNAIIDQQVAALGLRSNVLFAPRVQGVRASDRSRQESGFNFPGAIEVANSTLVGGSNG